MPNFSEDILVEIPENEIIESCAVVARELPLTYYTYGFMTTCYERREVDPAYDVTFYRHRDNARSGIVVIILRTGNKTFGILPYACDGYENVLENVLVNTSKINWSERPLIQGILPRHYDVIENALKQKKFEAKLYVESTIQVLPIETALNFKISIPEDVYIRQLMIEDVNSIYDLWPHKDVWTTDEIICAIRYNTSFGVYSRDTDEIRAWIMFPHYGGVGMLYTKEDHRRSGHAKLLIMIMSKELARKKITPFTSIVPSNIKSLSLFNALGYRKATHIKYFNVCEK